MVRSMVIAISLIMIIVCINEITPRSVPLGRSVPLRRPVPLKRSVSLGRSVPLRKLVPLESFPFSTRDSFQWFEKDGSYRFGLQGSDQWRVEKRLSDGRVFVRFAFRTPDGQVMNNSFAHGRPSINFLKSDEDGISQAVDSVDTKYFNSSGK